MVINNTFSSVTSGPVLLVRPSDSVAWSVTGTFVGTWILEASLDGGGTWQQIARSSGTATGDAINTFPQTQSALFRFRCDAYTSGSIVTSITEDDVEIVDIASRDGVTLFGHKKVGGSVSTLVRTGQKYLSPASLGHPGAGSGFVTRAAANTDLVTVPQSQTAATYVIPLLNLRVGSIITAFHLIGEVTSAGGTVTVDCALYKHTAAAGTDAAASLQAMTQISVTANTLIDEVNSLTALVTPEAVAQDKSYFLLITVTTGASCTGTFQSAAIVVTES